MYTYLRKWMQEFSFYIITSILPIFEPTIFDFRAERKRPRAEPKILQLELQLEPARIGLITTNYFSGSGLACMASKEQTLQAFNFKSNLQTTPSICQPFAKHQYNRKCWSATAAATTSGATTTTTTYTIYPSNPISTRYPGQADDGRHQGSATRYASRP